MINNWLQEVIERAKAAAERGPAPMRRGSMRHLPDRSNKELKS